MRPITDNKYIDNVRNFLMAAGLNQVFDDCWIYLSENGEYSELLIKTVNGFKLMNRENSVNFTNEEEVLTHFNNENLFKNAYSKKAKSTAGSVEGFLTSVDEPFAVKHESGLPAFKKAEGHTQIFAAGYYILNRVEAGSGWMRSFCPKIETLINNDYAGPFNSELEQLSVLNAKKKQDQTTN